MNLLLLIRSPVTLLVLHLLHTRKLPREGIASSSRQLPWAEARIEDATDKQDNESKASTLR